jgi:hypothetical protein
MAREVVLQNHRVAGGEDHLAGDDENSPKGLVTSGMGLLRESKGLA